MLNEALKLRKMVKKTETRYPGGWKAGRKDPHTDGWVDGGEVRGKAGEGVGGGGGSGPRPS